MSVGVRLPDFFPTEEAWALWRIQRQNSMLRNLRKAKASARDIREALEIFEGEYPRTKEEYDRRAAAPPL